MFYGVHDSEIVAYSVDSRTSELVFVLAPGTGPAAGEFRLIFRGVEAHQFAFPQLPSIVLDLVELPAETLLKREWPNLSEGFQQCGWPGSWAASREAAAAFCASSELKAYELEQTFGMSGWILARSVERVDGDQQSTQAMPSALLNQGVGQK
jgi:hypothetical protein